jgi:hypothetical protein
MVPPKRRTPNIAVEHHGRVTHRVTDELPRADRPVIGAGRPSKGPATPAASSRYTPPIRSVRIRPDWHRRVGFGILFVGILVVVLNDVPLFGGRSILPFGHSELYLVLGLLIAGSATRMFGWFDRPTS